MWWRSTHPPSGGHFATAYRNDEPGYTTTLCGDRSPEFARVDPDWSKVVRDWDGVHLSTGGYLTTEDVSFQREGVKTELRGWNMESTVWLRWAFSSVEALRIR